LSISIDKEALQSTKQPIMRLLNDIFLRQTNNMIEAAKSVGSDIFLLAFFNIPYPKWFIL
jgi:hypothetical protein